MINLQIMYFNSLVDAASREREMVFH